MTSFAQIYLTTCKYDQYPIPLSDTNEKRVFKEVIFYFEKVFLQEELLKWNKIYADHCLNVASDVLT